MASHSKKGVARNAHIAFVDESGISERPSVRRTWAPKGKTPIIVGTGSWNVRSVVGVIACTPAGGNPKLYIRIFPGTIHKEETLRFLKELRYHEHGNVTLLWDRLAAHRARIIKEYTAKNQWLSVEYFPSYAPELNPVEYVWATAKNRDLANLYPQGLRDLDRHIRNMKKRLKRRVDLLKGFLRKSSLFC